MEKPDNSKEDPFGKAHRGHINTIKALLEDDKNQKTSTDGVCHLFILHSFF